MNHREQFETEIANIINAVKELERHKWQTEVEALRKAAQAMVDRWDKPFWSEVKTTQDYVNELRAALAAWPEGER